VSPFNPLCINAGFLLNQPAGTSREIPFEELDLILCGDFPVTQFAGSVEIGRTPQGILAQGKLHANTELECVNCLSQYSHRVQAEFSELYAFSPKSMTDSELVLPDDAKIDLSAVVRDFMLLDIPMSPVCRQDCKGLCLECGENLNEVTCVHQREIEDAENYPDNSLGRALRKALTETT
jgi:uncharacterized protein